MIGQRLAERYEILEELGQGVLGREFLAEDPLLDRRVVVKWFGSRSVDGASPSTPGLDERPVDLDSLLREARGIAGLSHPAIASVFDVGRFRDGVFLVMPRIQGRPLADWHRERGLDLGELLQIGADVAAALACAAEGGVLHRNVRPDTIWVSRDHGQLRCRLTDFLPATGLDRRLTTDLARPMAWVCPEVLAGSQPDHRSDLFCLGLLLVECLQGTRPFGSPPPVGDRDAFLERVERGPPEGLDLLGLGTGLDALMARLLAVDPLDRPGSGHGVAVELKRLGEQASEQGRRRLPATSPPPDSFQRPRWVGRREILGRLDHHLGNLIADGCRCLLVEGEAGVGKTRLLEELESIARGRGDRVLWSRSTQREGTLPLARFQGLIEDGIEQRGGRLRGDLEALAPALHRLFPTLVEGAGDGDPVAQTAPRRGDESPDALRDTHEVLARVLLALAEERPLVLLIENLHGAEATVEALEYLVPRLAPKALLFAGSYRASEVDADHPLNRLRRQAQDDPRCEVLKLEPLDASAHAELVAGLLGLPGVPPALARDLYEASDGNPFVTRELVRSWIESGDLPRRGAAAWSEGFEWGTGSVPASGFPDTVQQVMEGRLAALDGELHGVLSAAAVIGRTFDRRLLVGLSDRSPEATEDALDALLTAGLIEEDRSRGTTLRFAGSVLRDVLYQGLADRRRRALHRRCAEWLERRWEGRLERIYPDLVHHFWNAGREVETIAYALLLARRSADLWGPTHVVRSARIALAALDQGAVAEGASDAGEVEGELRRLLAVALARQGAARSGLREAVASARAFERAGEELATARSALLAARLAWSTRRVETAERWATWGLERCPGEAPVVGDEESTKDAASTASDLRTELANLGARIVRLRDGVTKVPRCPPENGVPAGGKSPQPSTSPRERRRWWTSRRPPEGTVRVAACRPPAWDPVVAQGEEVGALSAVFETLTRWGPDGELEPGLAVDFDCDAEHRRWRVRLRDGVVRHDGRSLDGEAVTESLRRLARDGASHRIRPLAALRGLAAWRAGATDDLEGLRVVDRRTLEIVCDRPEPRLPLLLSSPATAIALPGDTEGWIGSGPFRRVRGGDRLELEAWGGWWGEARQGVGRLVFEPQAATESVVEALRAGDLDLVLSLPMTAVEGLERRAQPDLAHYQVPAASTTLLWLDRRHPAMAERRQRRALVATLGLEGWLVPALAASGTRARSLLPPGWGGGEAGGVPRPRRMPTGDARVLETGGGLSMVFDDRVRRDHGMVYQGIVRALTDHGLDLGVQSGEGVEVLGTTRPGDVEFACLGWDARYADPAAFFDLLVGDSGGWSVGAEIGERIARHGATAGPAERRALAREIVNRLRRELEIVPLFHGQRHHFAHRDLLGFDPSQLAAELRFERLSWRP